MDYPKPSLTVDAVVLAGSGESMRLLVIERDRNPFAGTMALPGGFVDPFENPFVACLRELKEETGLEFARPFALPLRLRARKGRDPRGWTLSQPYLFAVPEPLPVQAADDARRAEWMPLAELASLAFDHGSILCEALGRFWQEMPGAFPLLGKTRAYGAPENFPSRPTFYGGSFNPLHEGHLTCAALFPCAEELIVVPDSNPFKPLDVQTCAWWSYRALQAAFAESALAIYPGFAGMELPNPTVSWLPYVKGELGLLIGEDSLAALPSWYGAEKLVDCLKRLFVVPRRATRIQLTESKAFVAMHSPLCHLVELPDHAWRDMSSSKLRATGRTS